MAFKFWSGTQTQIRSELEVDLQLLKPGRARIYVWRIYVAKEHAKSGLPGSPVGSGCAAASISVPQPVTDTHCFADCLSLRDRAPPSSTRVSQYNY